ncbi:putative quinol monooxygenase [Rhizobium terrae]|uniref:putative quinol monooxygenase n=1 Tax=Rhizobium terrae TaxID=2171756 RepID=UPI0038579CCD
MTDKQTKGSAMPVTYVIRFHIRPRQRDRFMTLLEGVLDAMRHEPMFRNAVLHADPGNKNHMMLYETWEDHADVLEVQLKRPYREAWHEALPDLLESPRDISIWQPVREDRAA